VAQQRVAYLTGRYPAPSHTFILREVLALRRLGVDVDAFSVWQSAPDQLLSSADRAEAAVTFNLLPLRGGELVRRRGCAGACWRRAGSWRR
jgi:hypothetical protein